MSQLKNIKIERLEAEDREKIHWDLFILGDRMYMCIHRCVCVCIRVCMYIYIYTHTHTHSHTVALRKTLESPLDCKESQPVHPKGNQP